MTETMPILSSPLLKVKGKRVKLDKRSKESIKEETKETVMTYFEVGDQN